MSDADKTITHDFPVWRDTADFIIAAALRDPDVSDICKWEQIWAKKVGENLFEICCIPFFYYGLSLGDIVSTAPNESRKYVIDKIVTKKGHTTYRLWFESTGEWHHMIDEISSMGCLVEVRWEKSRLIAIDAPDEDTRTQLEVYLKSLESKGGVKCEVAY